MSEYKRVLMPRHRLANSKGYVYEHVIIAEQALGKPLPPRADVHHVDENTKNNARTNLVICQDRGYHKLLHARARIVRVGGDPNTHALCGHCNRLKPFADFNKNMRHKSYGIQRRCRECSRSTFKDWWLKHKTHRHSAA